MAITKYSNIVRIEYPDGSEYTTSLAKYTGDLVHKYNPTSSAFALFGWQTSKDVLRLDIPEMTTGQALTWKFFFSGSYEGEALPPVLVTLTKQETNTYTMLVTSDQVHGTTLLGSLFTGSDVMLSRFAVAFANNDSINPDDVSFMVGPINQYVYYNNEMQWLPCLEGTIPPNATLYYNSMSEIANGYPFGPVTDPDRYVSKPTESEASMEDDSDPIEIDSLPSAVVPGGLFRIYEMTNTQMTDLSNALVNPSVIESISRLVASPWDYIINLKAMPVTFPGYTTPFRIGNYAPTLTSNPKELNTFIMDVDCGSIALNEMYGSFADYSPYTKVTLYCPFCGYIPINIDLFQNNHIKVKYRVDVVSGDCVCFISNDEGLISTLSGNCAYNLPLRANDSSQLISGLFTALGGAIKTSTGDVSGGGDMTSGFGEMMSAITKPHIVTSGSLSANSGSMANRKPYLIIERPTLSIPKTYPEEVGFSSKITAQLGTLKGFTVVSDIIFEHVIATDDEKAEIESLLKQGVEI